MCLSAGAHGVAPEPLPGRIFDFHHFIVGDWPCDEIPISGLRIARSPISTGKAKSRFSSPPRNKRVLIAHETIYTKERFPIFKSLGVLSFKKCRFQWYLDRHGISRRVNSTHRWAVSKVQWITVVWFLRQVWFLMHARRFAIRTASHYGIDQLPFHYPQRTVTDNLKVDRRFVYQICCKSGSSTL
jgi:hypothetical protein